MKNKIISVKNINKNFEDVNLIKNLSFDVYDNESFTIIGPSGCGKTSLLKVIAGIVTFDSGQVSLFGKDISKLSAKEKYWINKKTGFLFQNHALFDSMNVLDNITFYLTNHTNMKKKEMFDKARFLLSIVGLENIEDMYPSELSGGMKKRVGLIRAIIHKPQILFLDEPVAGLDPVSADVTTKIIHTIKEKFNLTLLNISNELDYARKISNKIGLLYEGKLYNIDKTENFFSSNDPLIKQFVMGLKSGPIVY